MQLTSCFNLREPGKETIGAELVFLKNCQGAGRGLVLSALPFNLCTISGLMASTQAVKVAAAPLGLTGRDGSITEREAGGEATCATPD